MKILITGGSGLLGQYLNIELDRNHQILTIYNSNPGNCLLYNSAKVDMSTLNQLDDIFQFFKPEAVVHTAAISRIDLADKLPAKYVTRINVDVTRKIAELCERISAKLIYTSTDLVYDGSFGGMLEENAPLKPLSFYAKTKLSGEKEIKNIFENYIILRTALLYGIGLNHSQNYFGNMYLNLRKGKPVKLFYDQYRSPLAVKEAARIISEIITKKFSREIINFGGKERVSRYELGEILCEEAGLDKSLLLRTSMNDFPEMQKTYDVSMNTEKLNLMGIVQASIRESIKTIVGNGDSYLSF